MDCSNLKELNFRKFQFLDKIKSRIYSTW